MLLRQALALFTTLLALAFGAHAQEGPWKLLKPPQPTENNGKIEVIEFFWYGCPHCYALEPELVAWLKHAPKDVEFKRVPAYPSESWGEAAKIFYTLETMGLLPQLHEKAFDAIHKEQINLMNKRQRDQWLTKNGVDPAKYDAAEKSFTVATKLARAKQMTQAYHVDGVPRVIVAGKYYTSSEQAGGATHVFPVVDQLIDMARREQQGTAHPAAAPAKK
ncbi:MAG TPA: thiol:disulfide interchange protein DsbA/DsbL [Usitatibacter sp.]|jgi:thiol:disulfide interchange protein DsbA|nr:thiol:disulfide interchange protein DsbA/DsbL [Usitatibacter sp.]